MVVANHTASLPYSSIWPSVPMLLQPKMPLRTIPTRGIWNRDPTTASESTSAETSISPEIARLKQLDHFELRTVCLEKYFDIFSKWSPSVDAQTYPLVRSHASISEDVGDHARLMGPYESWEEEKWETWLPSPIHGGNEPEEDDEERDMVGRSYRNEL